ncbi:brachyurin-like [Schistocerca cancellata]|uniref:brachyurin-like n=1 Tax=Schistocerca cancellata TaxID=274614 RepID=UPI00211879E1|nr:brachyurin-like [Schistocerca cancellata]
MDSLYTLSRTALQLALILVASAQMGRGVDIERARPVSVLYPDTAPIINLPGISRDTGSPRVVGGSEAAEGSVPYQAAIYLTIDGLDYFCGGSLIAPSFVLTAAHCTVNVTEYTVILGGYRVFEASDGVNHITRTMDSSAAIVHPQYVARKKMNDIALLKLSEPVPLSEKIKTVRLPSISQSTLTFEEETATVSGWGKYNDSVDYMSPVLKTAQTKVTSLPVCQVYYLTLLYGVQTNQICTISPSESEYASPCDGDSGGPLVVVEADGQPTLVGAVSFGISSCESHFPSVYARVTSHLQWIADNTGITLRQ